jgi:outer membrane protein OmpA-like peptidoglycan-associated protein
MGIAEKAPMPMLIGPGKSPAKSARPDVAGAKDYPGFPRLPLQRASYHDEKAFDSFDFLLADGTRHRVEGKKILLRYDSDKLPDGEHPASQWEGILNYKTVLAGQGWTILRLENSLLTATLKDHNKETWAELRYNGGGETGLTIVERGEMKQVVSASSLLDQLKREGRVAFDVHFDTNSDVIKAESKPVLAQMIELLKADPALKTEVAGHTDNVGNDKDNLALSQRRAASVMAALISGGIEASA